MNKPTVPIGPGPLILAGLRIVLLVGLGVVALAGGVWSDESPPSLSPANISRYVADLNSDSRAVRAAAESALLKAGPAVLDELPLVGSLPDPTARESLERVIRSIEARQFQTALTPRTALLADVHTLAEAVSHISQQTGNPLVSIANSDANSPVTFAATPLTFWEAISSIEQQRPLHYQASRLVPEKANTPHLPTSLSGPFRAELLHCEQRVTPRGEKLLNAKIRLTCEPRLRPLFLIGAVDDWSITSGTNQALPFTPMARREIPATGTGEIDVSFDFVIPAKADDHTAWTIAGEVDLTLAAMSAAITFSDLTAKLPLTRRRGQSSLSLLKVTSVQSTGSSVRLATAFPHLQGLFESYRASLLAPIVTLENSTAPPRSPIETIQLQEAPQGLILEYQFDSPLSAESRITATIPAAISTQKIPFRFENITPTTPTD